MKTVTKKKLEIVVENSLVDTMVSLIDGAGATGYTLVPCVGGRGRHGPWKAGQISPAFDRVYLMVVTEPAIADEILGQLSSYLSKYSMVVNVSDTEVIRGDAF